MKVTYLNHSGFLLELGETAFLFDYYKNDIPDLSRFMNIYVFVSHSHRDHFNADIFLLDNMYDNVFYILSKDIALTLESKKIPVANKMLWVDDDQFYELNDFNNEKLSIRTIPSTDEGVAFYLTYRTKHIYHAGDLNLWVWKEESDAYNKDMTTRFHAQMEKLKGEQIDIAFVPLDPRQEEDYAKGLIELLNIAEVKTVFPMHFWNKHEICHQFMEEHADALKSCVFKIIESEGDEFYLE